MATQSNPNCKERTREIKSLPQAPSKPFVGYMQVQGPLLCLNGHITVKHMLQNELTPSWCNTEGCEWYWATQEKHPTTAISYYSGPCACMTCSGYCACHKPGHHDSVTTVTSPDHEPAKTQPEHPKAPQITNKEDSK